jgi:membrane-associated phospholipid phosphatase
MDTRSPGVARRFLDSAVPVGALRVNRPLLIVALIAGAAVAALTFLVHTHPYLPQDAALERSLQAVDVGPLVYVFSFYTAIGGPFAIVAEVVVFGLVILLNRQAWRLVLAAVLSSGWYLLLSHLVVRPRPAVGEVLRVTEHPGASSFPSGHTILFVTYAVVVMVCLGYKYLPARVRPAGWAIVVLLLAIGALSRMYSGAHWPSDVLAGLLIGVGWLSFVISISWISDPVLRPAAASRPTIPRVVPGG